MSNPYDKQVGGDHYSKMKIQPAEFVNKNKMLFAEGNAIKYICRHINKGGKQDLEKAKHYIDMIIERDRCRNVRRWQVQRPPYEARGRYGVHDQVGQNYHLKRRIRGIYYEQSYHSNSR